MKGLIRTKYICEKKLVKSWENYLAYIFSGENNESTIFELKDNFPDRNKQLLGNDYGHLKKIFPYIEHIVSTLDYKSNKKPVAVRCVFNKKMNILNLKNANKI